MPTVEHIPVLKQLDVDGILDVGANRGQFTLACRLALRAPIVAFEPIPQEAEVFQRVHGQTPGVRLIEAALGDHSGRARLHLSGRADSSSLLPIGARQEELFPETRAVGEIEVIVERLDRFQTHWPGCSRLLLKLDVQGFELQVLRGAPETLRNCAYVYAECSEVPLYDGQALRVEVASYLESHGFRAESRWNPHYRAGELIQADYLFAREPLRRIQ